MNNFSPENLELLRKQEGFSTLDVLIAFFIMVISISGLAMVSSGNQNTSVSTQLSHTGVVKTQQLLEGQRALAYSSFDSVTNVPSTSDPSDPTYLQQVVVTSPDQCHKVVTGTVSWAEPSKPLQSASLTTLFADVSELAATGGACGGGALPQTTYACVSGTCQAVLGGGGEFGSVAACQASCTGATHAECVNNTCTVVNGSGSNSCSSPGTTCSGTSGSTHAECVNNTCTVVNGSGSNSCSNVGGLCSGGGALVNNCPANLNVTAGRFRPGNNFVSAGFASGVSVLNNKAYLSFQIPNPGDNDLFIVDVSNSQTPQVLNSFSTGDTGGLNALTAVSQAGKTLVFTAGNSPTSQLRIVDVSDPLNPVLLSSYQFPNSGTGSAAKSIFYRDNKVYVGTMFTNDSSPEFYVIDVSDPANPATVGSYKISSGVGSWGQFGVNGIFVKGTTAFLTTQNPQTDLVVLDVTNPGNIHLLNNYDIGGANGAQSLYYLDNKLYIGGSPSGVGSSASPGKFFIVDVSTPASPSLLGSTYAGGVPYGTSASGLLAFTGGDSLGIGVWDVSSPSNIKLCTSQNFSFPVTGMTAQNGLLYESLKSNVDPLRIIKLY